MENENDFFPVYEDDIEKMMRDTGTKIMDNVYGKTVGDYPPLQLCRLMFDIAEALLLKHPGMTTNECEENIYKMENDHQHCISINGDFGLKNYKTFNQFEVQCGDNIIKTCRRNKIAPLVMCKELIDFGRRVIIETFFSKDYSKFNAFKEKSGLIWFHLSSDKRSTPIGIFNKLIVLVQEFNGHVKCAFGMKREDVFVEYLLIKK